MSDTVYLINGQPNPQMDRAVRARMEQAFGADLSGVRPVGGGAPGGSAQSYVTGSDVFFLGSGGGQNAHLGHEAAHVVQQRQGSGP